MNMEKPDFAEFARNILWHLTWLRAEVQANRSLLAQVLANQTGRPAKEFEDLWAKEIEEHQKAMYLQALDEVKISSGPELDSDEEEV
jgi:hypothetical protein